MSFVLSDLKRPPVHVVLLRWPRDGEAWIHPEDRELARRLLPSDRVFRRERVVKRYNVLRYGRLVLRIEPVLWRIVPDEGFLVGDPVEVLSRLGRNDPGLGAIREMRWCETTQTVWYQLRRGQTDDPRPYAAADLRLVESFERQVFE